MSIVLAATAALLFGVGTYLVLQHTLSRILIGLALIGHGGNVLLMASGRRGAVPIVDGQDAAAALSDPLAQALALTAIVISFGVSALLLALAYRSWILHQQDEVQDDLADRLIARHGHADKEIADEEQWVEGTLPTGGDS